MRTLSFTAGFLIALCSITLLGSIAVPVLVIGLGLSTYHLFIAKSTSVSSMLVGAAICLELLGSYRPGIFLLIVLVMHITLYLAPLTLRFTSPFVQLVILYLVHTTLFLLLTLPIASIQNSLVSVLVVLALSLLWAYSAYTTRSSKQPQLA